MALWLTVKIWAFLRRCNTRQRFAQLALQRFNSCFAALRDQGCYTEQCSKIRCSVATVVVKNRIEFYFSQRLRQRKNCETRPLRGMSHWAIFRATCVTTKLRDKFHETLFSVTLSLRLTVNFFPLRLTEIL